MAFGGKGIGFGKCFSETVAKRTFYIFLSVIEQFFAGMYIYLVSVSVRTTYCAMRGYGVVAQVAGSRPLREEGLSFWLI